MKRSGRSAVAALALYALFFGALFLPMASSGRLPGNCDTWLNGIAIPNLLSNRVAAAITGDELGSALYPASDVVRYGESAVGIAAIFAGFRALLGDDVLAYYPFVVLILALDGLGVFLLARWYVESDVAAGFAGLAFAASVFTLGNLDSPHTSFFFLALVCLSLLKRYLVTGGRPALWLAALVGGVQVFFSAYVFFFQTIASAVILVWSAPRARLRELGGAAILYGLLASPFFLFYHQVRNSPDFVSPWDLTFLAEVHSLEPADLLRTLENNVLYRRDAMIRAGDIGARVQGMLRSGILEIESLTAPDAVTVMGEVSSPDDPKYFVYTRRCAFLGIALYALALFGARRSARRGELASLYVLGLVLSFGPVVWLGDVMIPNATLPLYEWGLASPLRVPSRAFSLSVLAIALLAANGLEELLASRRLAGSRAKRLGVVAVVTAVFLLENVPWPLKSFAGAELATPEPLVTRFFADEQGHVVLDLPSSPGGALYGDSGDLFAWNREAIYMNRQTYHRQSTVNGVHGYFPRTRLQVQHLIDALPSDEAVRGLRELGVDYILYHRTLELGWEAGHERKLSSSDGLELVASSPEVAIYGFRTGARDF